MKKTILFIGLGIILLFAVGLAAIHLWIGSSVKDHIELAQDRYGGNPEDALIAYLLDDENNSFENRTHTAIWTLGQIRSEKALPILKEHYKDDPDGDTCYGKHDSMFCQYELHKAIVAIEKKQFFNHERLKVQRD